MFKFLGIHISKWIWALLPLRFFLRPVILPEGLDGKGLKEKTGERDVIYVLPKIHLLDALALNIVLSGLGLPRIWFEANGKKLRKASFLAIKARDNILLPKGDADAFLKSLSYILGNDPRVATGKLSIVPVSIFWSRGARREERNFLLKSLFPDDMFANSFQKFLLMLLHRGRFFISFGEARTLGANFSSGELENPSEVVSTPETVPMDSRAQALKVRRQLLMDFSRERAALQGPELYNIETIAEWILSDPETKKLITSLNEKPESAEKKVLKLIEEIAATYNYSTVRALEIIFDIVWTRVFKGVRVRNFEAVAPMARKGQVIWTPSHRSHLDYLLLSYVLFKKGLVAPHIAAGINLFFFPVSSIIRRAGAFSIRRSFAGNKLYSHVFTQYINFLLHQSYPVEFFHEGTRSRIGKLLEPKYGVTSMCVSSIIKRRAENTYFIPVYFGYDRVMEDDSYARELGGAKKKNESLLQMLMAIPKFFSNYGRVDVSFGNPIPMGELWETFFEAEMVKANGVNRNGAIPTRLKDIPDGLEVRDARIQAFVKHVGRQINQGINAVATASASSLLTAVLLASRHEKIPVEQLKERLRLLHFIVGRLRRNIGWNVATTTSNLEDSFILEDPDRPDVVRLQQGNVQERHPNATVEAQITSDKTLDEILAEAVKWGLLIAEEEGKILKKNSEKEMNLWWYRGTAFHLLAVIGIVAALVQESAQKEKPVVRAELETQFASVRHLWVDELYWPDATSSGVLVQASLDILAELGAVAEQPSGLEWLVPNGEATRERLAFLSALVAPERDLYSLQVAQALSLIEEGENGSFARDELVRALTPIHRAAFLRGLTDSPASLSAVFATRTFDALLKRGIFVPQEDKKHTVSFTEVVGVSEFLRLKSWGDLVVVGK